MSNAPRSDIMRIFVRDCRVNLRVGVFASEMTKTQPVIVNVECEALADRYHGDISEKDLTLVVNYKPIYHFIRDELPAMGHVFLLESAAEHIVDFCMKDARVRSARVRIEKTAVFPDAAGAGVELVRTRA